MKLQRDGGAYGLKDTQGVTRTKGGSKEAGQEKTFKIKHPKTMTPCLRCEDTKTYSDWTNWNQKVLLINSQTVADCC